VIHVTQKSMQQMQWTQPKCKNSIGRCIRCIKQKPDLNSENPVSFTW